MTAVLRLLILVLAASLAVAQTALHLSAPRSSTPAAPVKFAPAKLTEEQRGLHALSRLTFGPRPGDLQKVMAMGVDEWVEQQLHPDEISNGAMDAKRNQFRTLRMQTVELVQTFPTNNLIRAVADGKNPMPTHPTKRAIYEVQISILEEQQRRTQLAKEGKAPDADAKAKIDKQNRDSVSAEADDILALPKEKRMAAILAMAPDQRRLFLTYVPGPQRDRLVADFSPDQRELFQAMIAPLSVVTNELQQAKLLRAVYSERQLQEVMTDFRLLKLRQFGERVHVSSAFLSRHTRRSANLSWI